MDTMNSFEYGMRSLVHCGPGAAGELPRLFSNLGARRVLLLSDRGLDQAGLVARVAKHFDKGVAGVELVAVYCDISADAEVASINGAIQVARECQADGLLALGGGSVLDACKGVKYGLQYGIDDIATVIADGAKMEAWADVSPSGIAHIAVPTTAGTGAEVTAAAVIYNAAVGTKGLLVSPYICADIAVLDAELTVDLPMSITVSTAMDALTHAIEAVASPSANPFTDAHALRAAQMIEQSLPVVVAAPSNLAARSALLQASTMACNAISNALNIAYVHNISHALGGRYRIPHGEANGVLLPIVLETLAEFYQPNAQRIAQALNIFSAQDDPLAAAVARIRKLQAQTGFDPMFSRFDIPASDVDIIVAKIQRDPMGMLATLPADKIQRILQQAAGWPA